MMKAAPFSFRDTIQYVLPVLIGMALFIPYAASPERLEIVLLGGALFSYVLYTPINCFAKLVFRFLPILRQRTRRLQDRNSWSSNNWDYDKLFYIHLSDKEREYLYLTAGYADFHRMSGFFLLCYLGVQLVQLGSPFFQTASTDLAPLEAILAERTPILGGWHIPTVLAAVISAILFVTSMQNYLGEAEDILATQDSFAEKYHQEKGGIAKSIWGRVLLRDTPVKEVQVDLVKPDGMNVKSTSTDQEGRFQFFGCYEEAIKGEYELVLKSGEWEACRKIARDHKQVPNFEFNR